jgi:hypothetical protein
VCTTESADGADQEVDMFEHQRRTIARERDVWGDLHDEVRRLHPSRQLSELQRFASVAVATVVAAFVAIQLIVDGTSSVVAIVAGGMTLQLCRPFSLWMLGADLEWSPRRRVRRLHVRLTRAVATLERACGDVRVIGAAPTERAADDETSDRVEATLSAVRGIAAAQRRGEPAVGDAVDVRSLAARLDEVTTLRIRLRPVA